MMAKVRHVLRDAEIRSTLRLFESHLDQHWALVHIPGSLKSWASVGLRNRLGV